MQIGTFIKAEAFSGRCTGHVARAMCATCTPRELTTKMGATSTLNELVALHQAHGDSFKSIHVGAFWTAVKRLARRESKPSWIRMLRERGAQQLKPACDRTMRMLPDLNARSLATVAYALAAAPVPAAAPALFDALAAEVVRRQLGEFNSQDLSNTA